MCHTICRSTVGTNLETLLPDPPQWTADPITKESSTKKAKDKPSEAVSAASTAGGNTGQVMMVFDEDLGER